jgi:integrase
MSRERKGSIVERDKKLYARVQFTDEQGRKRDLWRTAESRTHAKEIIKRILREVEDSGAKILDAARVTFVQLADYYLDNYLVEARYENEIKVSGLRSLATPKYQLKTLRDYFGKRKLSELTYGDIRSFKIARMQSRTKHDNQRCIASTNRELALLRRVLSVAVRQQWLRSNPFNHGESLISAAAEVKRQRFLSRSEEERLLAAIDAEPKRTHLKGIILISLDCSLRRGEITSLSWSDVNLVSRTITVRSLNAKTSRSRTVAMTTRVYECLCHLWQQSAQDVNSLVWGGIKDVKRSFMSACRQAEISNFRFHDCRATAITRMLSAGLPVTEVMRISGHSTFTALTVYARADLDTAFRAAAALDAFHADAQKPVEAFEMVN